MRKWLLVLAVSLFAGLPLGEGGLSGTTAEAALLKNKIGFTYSLLLNE